MYGKKSPFVDPHNKSKYQQRKLNKRRQQNNLLDDDSDTSEKKHKTPKEVCPYCGIYFFDLKRHLRQNKFCSSRAKTLESDPSVISFNQYKNISNRDELRCQNKHLSTTSQMESLNRHHINLFESNDNDQNLVCVTDDFHDDNIFDFQDLESTEEEGNLHHHKTKTTYTTILDQNVTYTTNEFLDTEQEVTNCQSDVNIRYFQIEDKSSVVPYEEHQRSSDHQLFEETTTTTATTTTATTTTTTTPQSSPPLFHDFTSIQENIINCHKFLRFSRNDLYSIQMLKLTFDKQIASSSFTHMMHIQEDYIYSMFREMSLHDKSILQSVPIFRKTKESVLKNITKFMFGGMTNYSLFPTTKLVQLPGRRLYNSITKFDLGSLLLSFLNDRRLTTPSNLLIEDKYYHDPESFLSLDDSEKQYSDIHTGSWFLNAHRKLCASENKNDPHSINILCPIIMFIDGTPIDTFGNLKLDAIMFTLGIYNRETRNKSHAWRLLGYIPEVPDELLYDDGSKDADTKKKRQNKQRIDYHHMLKYLLKEFVQLQNSSGILWNYLDRTNRVRKLRLRPTLMYIIGDALGNDKLCDRFQSYGKATKYLCRDCLCPTEKLDDVDYKCTFTKRSYLKTLSPKELSEKSYHNVENNVFDELNFGHDMYGINGCTPSEILHQFLLGVVKKATDHFFDCITSGGLTLLKQATQYMSNSWSRQSDRSLPNIHMFQKELNKKKLTGDEHINLVFALYLILSQTHVTKQLVQIESNAKPRSKTIKKSTIANSDYDDPHNSSNSSSHRVEYDKIGKSKESVRKWVLLLERTICFYYWMKLSKIEYTDLKESTDGAFDSAADYSIREYLRFYNEVVVIPTGNGNKCMKDHQCLHIPHQIRRFGIPLNYDGSIGERHLKEITKQPARMTQKRKTTLAEQACIRYSEKLQVRLIHEILEDNGSILETSISNDDNSSSTSSILEDNVLDPTTNSTEPHYRRYIREGYYKYNLEDCNVVSVTTYGNKSGTKPIVHQKSLIKAIVDMLTKDYGFIGSSLNCFSRLTIISDNKKDKCTFRSSPYYNGGVWFDWCMTKWEMNETTSNYPSRIIMFIDVSGMEFNKNEGEDIIKIHGKYLAIIRTVVDDNRNVNIMGVHSTSCLLESFKLEDDAIRFISCDSIVCSAYVVPDLNEEVENRSIEDVYHNQKISYVLRVHTLETFSKSFIKRDDSRTISPTTNDTNYNNNDVQEGDIPVPV